MIPYSVYTGREIVNPGVKTDILRIIRILNDDEILFRRSRYFYELIFTNTKWSRTIWLNLNRIQTKVINDIRISKDVTGHVLITIERYKNTFANK
jgi:hypothetical protein